MPTLPGVYTRVRTLPNANLHDFGAVLAGGGADSLQRLRSMMRQQASFDSATLQQRAPDAAQTLLAEALPLLRREIDKSGVQEAARWVFVMPKVPLGDGHAVAVMSFAPLGATEQAAWMARHNVMRLVVSSFPAGGAAFTEAQMNQALGGKRGRTLPRNIRRPLAADVVARNAELYREDAPIAGLHLLGNNSWSYALAHLRGDTSAMAWQAVVHATTQFHSQDGLVLWFTARHPAYPEGMTWLSVHVGHHPVPSGDVVNAWLAPLLFHPTFQRAIRLAEMLPDLTARCGSAATDELMLNTEVARQVHANGPYGRQNDMLRAMDFTGGLLLNGARWVLKRVGSS